MTAENQSGAKPTTDDLSNLYRSQMNIGRLIAAWNSIELRMRLTVAILLDVDIETSEAIMKTTNFQIKKEIFSKIIAQKLDDGRLAERLKKIDSSSTDLWVFRNDIVHGIWQVDTVTGDISLIRAVSSTRTTPLNLIDQILERTIGLTLAFELLYVIVGTLAKGTMDSSKAEAFLETKFAELDSALVRAAA